MPLRQAAARIKGRLFGHYKKGIFRRPKKAKLASIFAGYWLRERSALRNQTIGLIDHRLSTKRRAGDYRCRFSKKPGARVVFEKLLVADIGRNRLDRAMTTRRHHFEQRRPTLRCACQEAGAQRVAGEQVRV